MSKSYEGYLLIADITGYTQYLSESELEHAQETLTALLQMLVENTRPPLVISRLAGDAVISYGLEENFFHGQAIVEKIEDTYVAFRKTIERLVLNNTCRCNACANIANLDLKFFIHHGTFGIQRISDHDELVGSDIILLHRLLKNSVTTKTGIKAYALFTDAAIRHLGAEGIVDSMVPHSESYEHLDEVQLWVLDMQPVWEEKRSTAAGTFPTERLWDRIEIDIAMSREQLWDYLIQPAYRNLLIGADRMEIANRTDGRIGPGSVYQCYHGDKMVPQTILEWQPFESMLVKEMMPMFGDVSALAEYRLEERGEGARLTKLIAKPNGSRIRRTLPLLMAPLFRPMGKRAAQLFKEQIEADLQSPEAGSGREVEISGDQIKEAAATSLRASENSK